MVCGRYESRESVYGLGSAVDEAACGCGYRVTVGCVDYGGGACAVFAALNKEELSNVREDRVCMGAS